MTCYLSHTTRITSHQVQECLCRPGAVERYFPSSPSAVALVRSSFADIISLEHVTTDFRAKIMAECDKWVLKPQRCRSLPMTYINTLNPL